MHCISIFVFCFTYGSRVVCSIFRPNNGIYSNIVHTSSYIYICYSFLRLPSCRRKAPNHWILGRLVSCVLLLMLWYFMLICWWNYFPKSCENAAGNSTENLNPWTLLQTLHFLSSLLYLDLWSSFFSYYFLSKCVFFPLFSQAVPQPGRHRRPMTAPKTQKDKASKKKKVLLTVLTVIVVLGILVTAGYFSESHFYLCSFFPRTYAHPIHHKDTFYQICKFCCKIRCHSQHYQIIHAKCYSNMTVLCPSLSIFHSFILQLRSWLTANTSSASVQ